MTRIFRCPCCEQVASPRTTPISEGEMAQSMVLMARKGWTPARLLAERSEDLDGIAPGLTDWLRRQIQ